tara:strand:+ start:133 stop:4530 length:4398 start_codon:yes stop_codon:yes gene_type:complete
MAEVKNAFIKSKMNKDLDSRLLPSGEYRDGQNIQVSKSEGEDVGALENAVGNVPATTSAGNVDFSVLSGCECNLKSIGIYADTNSSNIYIFLTNYGPETAAENAEYSPSAKNYIYSYNTLTSTTVKLVEGPFLNFSQKNPIYGINVLENLLFWTDNRNQPRKINLNLANPTGSQTPTYYTTEDKISVAKYNPYEVIDLYYLDGPPSQASNVYVSSLQDVTSPTLPNNVDNPYYNSQWPGDPDYLEDKFVTFSYRFIFTDGEQSIMAPFTQEAFIPKQDGYFLGDNEADAYRSTIVRFMENKVNSVGIYVPLPFAANTLNQTLDISEIEILYKESDSLTVKVLDSVPFSTFSKLTDGTANTSLQYLYDYQSRKPYKTIPESEIIRVYDKVPVKAFGQEVIGNRIVYSNFQDKHTPPPTIDYDVAVTPKESFDVTSTNKSKWTTSEREYPEHTIKQNRNYQVGFVLSDRYGRQSTVILSPVNSTLKEDPSTGIIFGGSTYYHPYTAEPIAPATNDVNSWPGDSLKVLVNSEIPTSLEDASTKGYPGLYNSNTASANYNPLGWYSYKIVVKQTEQEYYNVYLPGILDGYPDFTANATNPPPPDPIDTIAHITLLGDNINKVPRNLTEVGPEQKQYGSEVQLFGRVSPNRTAPPTFTSPYYPQVNSQTVVTISEQDNLFADANATAPYASVYQSDSNPYVARLSQGNVSSVVGSTLPKPIGSLQVNNLSSEYEILLGVFETQPVESLLDIFWETSTSGLISDLNSAAGASTTVSGWINFNFVQTEASQNGSSITSLPFAPAIDNGLGDEAMIDSEVVLNGISDGTNDLTLDFSDIIIAQNTGLGYKSYIINVVNPKRFQDDGTLNTFNFSFQVTNLDVAGSLPVTNTVSVTLGNEQPTIDPITLPIIALSDRIPSVPLYTFTGKNGATAMPSADQLVGLVWSIQQGSQVPAPNGTTVPSLILSSDGILTEPTGTAMGGYSFNLVLKDTNGGTGSMQVIQNIPISFGQTQINPEFGSTTESKLLAKGLQSSGLFWGSNYSVGSLIQTTATNAQGMISTGLGEGSRNAYQDLELSNTGLESQNSEKKYKQSPNIATSQGLRYTWRNENYKPSFFSDGLPASDSNSSLTQGTAYIKVDFRFLGWPDYPTSLNTTPEPTDQLGVNWLAFLQYRPDSSASWVTATDVEGQDIKFGSVQQNQLGLSGSGIGGEFSNSSQSFQTQGLLVNSSTSNAMVVMGADSAVSSAPWIGSQTPAQRGTPGSIASKVFVFGKDQGYETTADKFGEYRLLVKYPQSIQSYAMVPAPTTTTLPDFVIETQFGGPDTTDQNIDVKVSFGDFYYNQPNTPMSFGYRISETGSPSPGDSAAALKTPIVEVFAREWSFKYVTQFYTNPELTTLYTATENNYWYSYSALTTGNTNTNIGTENSSIKGLNETAPVPATINDSTFANRRWVAQFDGSGKKIPQTAKPSTSTF